MKLLKVFSIFLIVVAVISAAPIPQLTNSLSDFSENFQVFLTQMTKELRKAFPSLFGTGITGSSLSAPSPSTDVSTSNDYLGGFLVKITGDSLEVLWKLG